MNNTTNTKFCDIDEWSKEHILKIIDLLYNECISAGGDGDAAWYSTHYNIKDIEPILKEYNNKLQFPFKIDWQDGRTITWSDNQEGIVITNDEEEYKSWPWYIQMVIKT